MLFTAAELLPLHTEALPLVVACFLAPSLQGQSSPAGGSWHFPKYLKENLLPNTLDPWICCTAGAVESKSSVRLAADAPC